MSPQAKHIARFTFWLIAIPTPSVISVYYPVPYWTMISFLYGGAVVAFLVYLLWKATK